MGARAVAARRWPLRRVMAWALILAGIAAFVVAGDVRTNWVVGDIGPAAGEEALPRLGTIALMLGMALLARHQLRERRALPEARYRGPSLLMLLALITGLSVFLVLPVRSSINLPFEGGVPDVPSWIISTFAGPVATVLVTYLVLRARPLSGLRLFRDARFLRHAVIGVVVGGAAQALLLVVTNGLSFEPIQASTLQASAETAPGFLLPGQPLWLFALSAVVLAPVTEELFFRGLVLNAWLREYGRWVALIGSAALFGLVHFGLNPLDNFLPNLPWLALPAASGLVFGFLALRTGSLVAPIAAHATANLVTLVVAIAIWPQA